MFSTSEYVIVVNTEIANIQNKCKANHMLAVLLSMDIRSQSVFSFVFFSLAVAQFSSFWDNNHRASV